ncbi:Ca(2+)-dependent cysteine protease [Dissophora globulifera]|nr:Ca(2+)-dependent cysteine protease [Dissophora globulifera]
MSAPNVASDDIDPAILADVTRVVQELMRMQQHDKQHSSPLPPSAFPPAVAEESLSALLDEHTVHNSQDNPTLLPSSTSSSLTSSEASSSTSSFRTPSAIPSASSPSASFSSNVLLPPITVDHKLLSSQHATSQTLSPESAFSSQFKHTPMNSIGTGDGSNQAPINLLPGTKTPTRATSSVKGPSTNADEPGHKYHEHEGDTPSAGKKAAVAEIGGVVMEPTSPSSKTMIPRCIPSPPTRPRRKKALLVGINYFGDPNQLLGCINDTRDIFGFLNGYYNFRYQDTIMLTDDQIYEDKRPTGANIRYWMKWLVKDAEPQDSLFFHYAVGDEADGYDEIIYPCDYLRSGIISDDELYDLLVKELPEGVQLTALVDACHSGTMLDLPYVYNGNRVTALEKVTRTKVGAMAAMSASDIQFDLPGSNNSTSVQTQTTTTTTTTTTTVTMTSNAEGGLTPVITQYTSGSAMSKDGHLSPMDGLLPINCKEAASPLMMNAGQIQSTRSIPASEESDSGREDMDMLVPTLTVTDIDMLATDRRQAGSSVSAVGSSTMSKFLVPSVVVNAADGGDEDGLQPSRRHRSKSVATVATMEVVYTGVDDMPSRHRGIECDSEAWVDPIDDEIVKEESTGVQGSIQGSIEAIAEVIEEGFEEEAEEGMEEADEGMEEARRMAMFRKTKGNVVMFSGCRDDQASADIRASDKDAAIISSHHAAIKAATADGAASPTSSSKDGSASNALGYSLPQPFTSPMARGAVSYAWIQCLSQKPQQTYEELLSSMRYFMKQRDLEQIPQLGSGMPMDMQTVFSL